MAFCVDPAVGLVSIGRQPLYFWRLMPRRVAGGDEADVAFLCAPPQCVYEPHGSIAIHFEFEQALCGSLVVGFRIP